MINKHTHPSKSSPHHCSNCFSLVLYLPPEDCDSPINAEYVANTTPFLVLPFTGDDILAYLN